MERELLAIVCLFACITIGYGLECYSCVNQDSNRDKCTKTTKQCDQFQDSCTTYIRWGVPPYWSPHGDRIYYISKDCDTRQGCLKRRDAMMSHCKRDWYNDWACVECCTGDLCNYYVTLGAGIARASFITMVTGTMVAVIVKWLL